MGSAVIIHAVPFSRLDRLAEAGHRLVQGGAVVLDFGRWREDVAEEVTDHRLEPGLGAVDADDAEVLGADFLHARMKDSAGLLDDVSDAGATTLAGPGHETYLQEKRWVVTPI